MSNSIWPKPKKQLRDLDLIDLLIDTDIVGPDPRYLNEVRERGLLWVVNNLIGSKTEQKNQARAKLCKVGKYVGDPQVCPI